MPELFPAHSPGIFGFYAVSIAGWLATLERIGACSGWHGGRTRSGVVPCCSKLSCISLIDKRVDQYSTRRSGRRTTSAHKELGSRASNRHRLRHFRCTAHKQLETAFHSALPIGNTPAANTH
jgi:hypothetical protein